MKGLAFWFVFLGTLFALAGMVWGIQMSVTANYTLAPAHAHNNLIGYVTMVLYGLYYAKVPAAANTMLARIHFWSALLGALTMGIGIAMAISQQGELVVQIGSLATIVAMILFATNVWLHRSALTA
jgi:hypothetical protein